MVKFRLDKNNKVRFFMTVFLSLLGTTLLTISVGFSALNQNLNVSGDVEYEQHNTILYNVLKKQAQLGTYAKEYTESHHDSFNQEPTHNIYYWNATNKSQSDIIMDKWNVIFGGFCWQMIRTTDTGGVKMIYNGVPTSGKCINSGTSQEIEKSYYNSPMTSPADVGYMYNKRYTSNTKSLYTTEYLAKSFGMTSSNTYYFGTGVTYNSSTGMYSLSNAYQDTWANTYGQGSGLYTCKSTTDTTCSKVYYIIKASSSTMVSFEMSSGHLLDYYNTDIKTGSSYTESNGIYTLQNVTTESRVDWINSDTSHQHSYICSDYKSESCSTLKRIHQDSGYYILVFSSQNKYKYATNFSYNQSTSSYTLNSANTILFWDIIDQTNRTNLQTHHYTCFDSTGNCGTIKYVSYVDTFNFYRISYFNLSGGKNMDDIINEMLFNNSVNMNNSVVKDKIDNWYHNNLEAYSSKIEDTVFCNNRKLRTDYTLENLCYLHYTADFECENVTDKFSTLNSKAKLTYPIGLMTFAEMRLLGSSYLNKTGQSYWLMTPMGFYLSGMSPSYSTVALVMSYGGASDNTISNSQNGVRPAISLKPGIEYVSGNGSKDDPYVVE